MTNRSILAMTLLTLSACKVVGDSDNPTTTTAACQTQETSPLAESWSICELSTAANGGDTLAIVTLSGASASTGTAVASFQWSAADPTVAGDYDCSVDLTDDGVTDGSGNVPMVAQNTGTATPVGSCTITVNSASAGGMGSLDAQVTGSLIDAASAEGLDGAGTPDNPDHTADLDFAMSW